MLSAKQNEYIVNATHRWNLKTGAVRSGKSYVDISFVILDRLRQLRGKAGLAVILGVSKGTLERNVLQPMREIYTSGLIGTINSENIARIAGQDVYCLGAEKISQVSKLLGSSIKYCYGDEIAKWHPDVFSILKSRLDKPYSCFDGSCNPESPTHWLKQFIDSDADIYLQQYTIFDNPFLDPMFVDNLCKEYAGTIYEDRLIYGRWKRAEGAIYRKFADHPERFSCRILPDDKELSGDLGVKEFHRSDLESVAVGLDFGGTGSGHALVARGYTAGYRDVIGLMSRRYLAAESDEPIDSNRLDEIVCDFVVEVLQKYGRCDELFWDNAETVLGNSVRNAIEARFEGITVRPARKARINDRIQCTVRLQGAGRFFITDDCTTLRDAMIDAVWDQKQEQKTERLDDGTTDIDSLDAFEYTIERDMKYLIRS